MEIKTIGDPVPEKYNTVSPLNSKAAGIEKYRSLLFQIGIALGLSEDSTDKMVQEIMNSATIAYGFQKKDLSIKMYLSRLMVQKCVFTISACICGQTRFDNSQNNPYLPDIPLSFWAVYALYTIIGFTEVEIAHILNITVIITRERLNKAIILLNK
jgi:hypothetical protein